MTRTTTIVYDEGIFHGLPTFPSHDGKKYTALVTGANGISGSEIVNVLAEAPERWGTIYAMSRRPPTSTNPRVKPIASDFLSSTPEELAELFKKEGIKADFIFFTSYLQPPAPEGVTLWSNTDELESANIKLLSNFLSALTLASIIPQRFILQTGGKHYGLHLGPASIPMTEDTPAERVKHENFYFPQEDLLSTWSNTHSTHWSVIRPGFIIGANEVAVMNIAYALAIYASVQRELKGKLEFPADIGAWDAVKDNSYAKLIGYFHEWVALTESTKNEALNCVDDSPFSYGKLWPELAGWYGIPYTVPDKDEGKYMPVTLPMDPPPRGFGLPGKVLIGFSFEEWASRAEVKSAWERVQEREGLRKELDPWRSRDALVNVFATLDAEMLGAWGRVMTMNKAKKLGWHGHVDTTEGIRDILEKMVEMKMVPKV